MGIFPFGYNILWMVKKFDSLLYSSSLDDQMKALNSHDFPKEKAIIMLRNRNLYPQVIEEISSRKNLIDSGRVKLMVVAHPKTPLHLALDLIPYLMPMELLEVLKSPTAKPAVRKKAEMILMENLRKYPVGLKISMARLAPARAHHIFLKEKSEDVLRAFVKNSYMKEEIILRLLERKDLPQSFINFLYYSTKWGISKRVKLKIALSHSSPIPIVLRIINELNPQELREIKRDPSQPDIVLRRVNIALGKEE